MAYALLWEEAHPCPTSQCTQKRCSAPVRVSTVEPVLSLSAPLCFFTAERVPTVLKYAIRIFVIPFLGTINFVPFLAPLLQIDKNTPRSHGLAPMPVKMLAGLV
ncbi:hypothetical protein TRVL_07888 [Trypanosoma vivax]|nr:hypothetical protein TRVL_07888 [Trypanosoma vivax]